LTIELKLKTPSAVLLPIGAVRVDGCTRTAGPIARQPAGESDPYARRGGRLSSRKETPEHDRERKIRVGSDGRIIKRTKAKQTIPAQAPTRLDQARTDKWHTP
jgi:hypothetical protein